MDKKNRDTLDLTQRWGDLIIYPVNISTLVVELAKIKIHQNRIVSFTSTTNNNNHCYHKRLGACVKLPNGISTNCIM